MRVNPSIQWLTCQNWAVSKSGNLQWGYFVFFCDVLKDFASVKLADIIMVEGDPTQNISAIRQVKFVVKDGNIFDIRSLQDELGIKP
jgi:uncharacterized Fe-S radical SAM superfamily protein PflX